MKIIFGKDNLKETPPGVGTINVKHVEDSIDKQFKRLLDEIEGMTTVNSGDLDPEWEVVTNEGRVVKMRAAKIGTWHTADCVGLLDRKDNLVALFERPESVVMCARKSK